MSADTREGPTKLSDHLEVARFNPWNEQGWATINTRDARRSYWIGLIKCQDLAPVGPVDGTVR